MSNFCSTAVINDNLWLHVAVLVRAFAIVCFYLQHCSRVYVRMKRKELSILTSHGGTQKLVVEKKNLKDWL